MAQGVNKVIILGNVGQNPETKYMPSGGAVTNLTIATSESWKDKQTGQPQERTEWHRVVFFNKLAEIVAQYVKKGSKIYVEGQIRTRSWEQDGVKRYSTEIIASQMQMLDSRQDGNQGQQQRSQQAPQQRQQQAGLNPNGSQKSPYANGGYQKQANQATQGGFDDDFDDDIPF